MVSQKQYPWAVFQDCSCNIYQQFDTSGPMIWAWNPPKNCLACILLLYTNILPLQLVFLHDSNFHRVLMVISVAVLKRSDRSFDSSSGLFIDLAKRLFVRKCSPLCSEKKPRMIYADLSRVHKSLKQAAVNKMSFCCRHLLLSEALEEEMEVLISCLRGPSQ